MLTFWGSTVVYVMLMAAVALGMVVALARCVAESGRVRTAVDARHRPHLLAIRILALEHELQIAGHECDAQCPGRNADCLTVARRVAASHPMAEPGEWAGSKPESNREDEHGNTR